MSKFVTNIAPEKQDAALEKMIEIIVRELKPAIGAMVDEKLKEAGVGGSAKPDMAANLSQYMPPPAEDERWNTLPDGDAPRASNGRKMPSSLTDLYELPD